VIAHRDMIQLGGFSACDELPPLCGARAGEPVQYVADQRSADRLALGYTSSRRIEPPRTPKTFRITSG
jgi:hypothetical protein